MLWQASVFPFAVPLAALAFNPDSPKAEVDVAHLTAPIHRLAASSLLTLLEEKYIFVHRWTAESLKALMPSGTYETCCLQAGRYLQRRPASGSQFVADLTEATRLFLSAHAFDDAASSAWSLIHFLQPIGQTILWTELAREVSNSLPTEHDDKLRFMGEEAGGLLSLGLGNVALARYKEVLQLAERKALQEPGRADYQRDLSVSYNKLGDLQSALGEGEAARQYYEKSLLLREQLVKQEPGRADYQRDLSVSYDRLGDLQRALGEGDAARQYYEKSLSIAEQLVKQEPGRADYQRDLSVSYNKLGDLQRALGEGDLARQYYEKSLSIAEQLVKQEPGRADYQRDLSVSYNKLGDLQRALGEGEAARQYYEKSLLMRRAISEAGVGASGLPARPVCVV